ncbi:MAG: alpha/beta fold hydrolase [Chloroflexota bacterium]
MPYVESNGLRLYYELHGAGTPLCLVEGLGYASWMWRRQVVALAVRHRLLLYDNRDVGQSERCAAPYTARDLAGDLVGLLDALGIARAHLLGVSLGGYIAQEFALAYPERVWGLVLVATAAGGQEMAPIPAETARLMVPDPNLPPEQRLRQAMAVAFAPGWTEANPELFDQFIRLRLANPQEPEAWLRQAGAGAAFAAAGPSAAPAAPTLVVHGEEDRVLPVANALLLAARLPQSELVLIPGGGHLAFIEQADLFNNIVLEFLARIEGGIAVGPER